VECWEFMKEMGIQQTEIIHKFLESDIPVTNFLSNENMKLDQAFDLILEEGLSL